MDAFTFSRIEQVFHRAAALDGRERADLLDREAERSPELVAMVRELLQADEGLGGRRTVRPPSYPHPATGLEGERVGPFILRELIGHGGMGSVYRGERAAGDVEQQVAIKLLHGSWLDGLGRYRFHLETQVLARLEHPGIARLIDAGETPDGRPYLAMEYVDGLPITEHCDRRAASLETRLGLFRRACEAVSFAHRNLVLHRDLKPDHVLVTGEGEVKLVDFGIAKPLTERLGRVRVEATGTLGRMFSPLYASPEAITGGEPTVAMDVYGLGIVLYELLTGARPFSAEGRSARQIEDAVLGDDPPPPSRRAGSRSGGKSAEGPVPAARLKGDLDSIVLKCLQKAPAARFATVDELVDDLDRFLSKRPVAAREGRLPYRAGKLLRRRWLPLATAAAVAVALWAQSVATRKERDRARFVTDFMVSAFESADPTKSLAGEVTARQILEQSLRSLDARPPANPDDAAELLLVIARVQTRLGLGSEAWATLERAQASYDAGGTDPELETRLLGARALAQLERGEPEAARELAAEALRRPGLGAEDALRYEAVIAQSHFLASDFARSRAHFETLLPRLEKLALTRSEVGFDVRLGHGRTIEALGHWDEALEVYLEVLTEQRESLPATHPALLDTLSRVQTLYLRQRRMGEARRAAEEILELTPRLYGPDSVPMARALDKLASVESTLGRHAEAVEHAEAAIDLYRQRYGEEHKSVAMASFNLALYATLDPALADTADAGFASAIAVGSSVWAEDHRNLVLFRILYALFLNRQDRFSEAREHAGRALAIAEARPEYKDYDFYPLGELARAVAELALAPDPARRRAVERWLGEWETETFTEDVRAEAAAQARVAERYGVTPPASLSAASAPPF